jgi:hypothetical protein
VVINHSLETQDIIKQDASYSIASNLSPLTLLEKTNLEKALKKAEKLKYNKPSIQVDDLIQNLVADVLGSDLSELRDFSASGGKKHSKKTKKLAGKDLMKQFDKIMKGVDPKMQKKLRKLMD